MVFTDERLNRGAGVHVSDWDDRVIGAGLLELFPALDGLVEAGHVRHRASGAKVGENDADGFFGQDIRAFRHEVNAPEDDIFDSLLRRRVAGKLKAVPGEVREVDDVILLVMMAQDHELLTECFLGRLNPKAQLAVRKFVVNRR